METKIIGSKIAAARKKLNISQSQLADQLFISAQAVGKWERGESMPDIITLNRLSEVFKVDLNYFSLKETYPFADQPTEINMSKTLSPKSNWDFSISNWADADFSGLRNLNKKFTSANLRKCKFINSDLLGILFNKNVIKECDFSHSNLVQSQIKNTVVSANLFIESNLNQTKFDSCEIKACDFSNANLTDAIIKGSSFSKNILLDTKWDNTSFQSTYLSDLILNGEIVECHFENCTFKNVVMKNVTITNTFFKNNALKGLQFKDCFVDKLTFGFLKSGKANLTGLEILSI